MKRSDVTWWKQGYIRTLPIGYFIVLASSVKTKEVEVIEFHRIEQNVQFQVGIYHEKFQLDRIKNGRPATTSDQQIFPLIRFIRYFFIYHSKIDTIISIPLIAQMSLKLGKIRTETIVMAAKMADYHPLFLSYE